MNNKGFAPVVLIIVVAALLAIGIGGYVFLQQKDSTPPPTVEETPIVTLPPVAPTSTNSVKFSVSPTSGSAPLRVTFVSQNLSDQHRYGINYGDDGGGGPGMMEKKCIEYWPAGECGDPNGLSHRYVSPGTYTAQLNEYQCSGNWNSPDGGWTCSGTVEQKVIGTATITATETSNSEVVKPAAPGPFVADAVRGLMPKTLRVGSNEIVAEVRGYMFFEGETRLALYDGTKEINIGTRPDGLPNTVVSAQGEWMTENYVSVRQIITIPAELKGKTLVIRFIANDPSDNAKPRYWGTLINVMID